ncbi:putative T7SS-secreted protein [Haloechinothrix sp. LS1_15]|uniref:WXG100 family type VII secretion target n=1 Tax=Haloechinothrix sp. LS1_15 TaxID=2652248 RepID=UPI00294558AE|nr:hypothetical protein [Haloechinothrix sp. LS1_15]MDV6012343.1 hypothetical protein [Haloechinothrix sp. LS1_15]
MGEQNFPALGFDPARGNVGEVRAIAGQMADTSTYASEAHTVLTSVGATDAAWTGDAATAFSDKLGDLPDYLDAAHQSLQQANRALNTWADRLESHQNRARELERQARAALNDYEQKQATAETARNVSMQHPMDAEAWEQAQTAARAAGAAWDSYIDIQRQAENLRDTWEDDARICAEALDEARQYAPDQSMWDKLTDALGAAKDWVVDNLDTIADALGIISAIAGALALIPVLTPLAGPLALVTGAAALGLRAADMAANDRWDEPGAWVGLGTDTLGALPLAGPAFRAGGAAVGSLRSVDGLTPAVQAGGEVFRKGFGTAAAKAGDPSALFKAFGERTSQLAGGNPDLIARAADGGATTLNLGLNALDTTAGDYTGPGLAAFNSVGNWSETAEGASDLGRSVSQFASAVGRY